ncbi:MAG TPA: hypothetical protein VKX96_02520 [Chloroflexota bacterium]|nr:hypothetical protein [Chloroflexota bacterium]
MSILLASLFPHLGSGALSWTGRAWPVAIMLALVAMVLVRPRPVLGNLIPGRKSPAGTLLQLSSHASNLRNTVKF